MTVRELIKELEDLDPDKEVRVFYAFRPEAWTTDPDVVVKESEDDNGKEFVLIST